jgi:hypothetical protein
MAHETRERPELRLKRLQAEHDNGYHETEPRMNCVACKTEVADLLDDHILGLRENGDAVCLGCDWDQPFKLSRKPDWKDRLDAQRGWWDHIADLALHDREGDEREAELDVLVDFG